MTDHTDFQDLHIYIGRAVQTDLSPSRCVRCPSRRLACSECEPGHRASSALGNTPGAETERVLARSLQQQGPMSRGSKFLMGGTLVIRIFLYNYLSAFHASSPSFNHQTWKFTFSNWVHFKMLWDSTE